MTFFKFGKSIASRIKFGSKNYEKRIVNNFETSKVKAPELVKNFETSKVKAHEFALQHLQIRPRLVQETE